MKAGESNTSLRSRHEDRISLSPHRPRRPVRDADRARRGRRGNQTDGAATHLATGRAEARRSLHASQRRPRAGRQLRRRLARQRFRPRRIVYCHARCLRHADDRNPRRRARELRSPRLRRLQGRAVLEQQVRRHHAPSPPPPRIRADGTDARLLRRRGRRAAHDLQRVRRGVRRTRRRRRSSSSSAPATAGKRRSSRARSIRAGASSSMRTRTSGGSRA